MKLATRGNAGGLTRHVKKLISLEKMKILLSLEDIGDLITARLFKDNSIIEL